MEKCTISQVQMLGSPNPFALICTKKPDGTTNLAANSWWTYLSNNPPMIGFCLSAGKFSAKCLEQSDEAVICLPAPEIKSAAFQCGVTSGELVDKAKENGIELIPIPEVSFPVPGDSAALLPCRVKERHAVGDHIFFVCEVTGIYANPGRGHLVAMDGYRRLAIARDD